MDELVLCYHKGCGEKFNPLDNKEGSCRYHPGAPVFHDALKGWSCCSRRSTDFTEFLNIPGCTYGKHTNEKPPEPEKKPQTLAEDIDGKIENSVPVPAEIVIKPVQPPMERPSADEPLTQLEMNVGESLKQALAKLKQLTVADNETLADSGEILKGASCKNSGCLVTYESEETNREVCMYHPGVPVFHEGMKYWSCCQRKTTDFSSFLSQEGCASGRHLWKKKDDDCEKVACRFDWHQTPSSVTISVYAKVADPTKTSIEVNKVTAKLNIVFNNGKSNFDKVFVLKGVIDPKRSQVNLQGTKVEVILKKMEPGTWSSLELQ